MLSVFKLVSCKPGPGRPGNWICGPQGLRSSKCSKLSFGNIIIVIETHFCCFLNKPEV